MLCMHAKEPSGGCLFSLEYELLAYGCSFCVCAGGSHVCVGAYMRSEFSVSDGP